MFIGQKKHEGGMCTDLGTGCGAEPEGQKLTAQGQRPAQVGCGRGAQVSPAAAPRPLLAVGPLVSEGG